MRNQDTLMKFDPATGWSNPYPSHATQWRHHNGTTAWLFNPWTGERRTAQDVGSDTFGYLIRPPGEPLVAAQETGTALCPHGMPLAENICGPCSEGRLNATPDDLGFGVPVLRDMALELMRRNGLSKEEAITEVAHDAELRSEAIEALRRALNR